MSTADIQHAAWCMAQPGEKAIRTETYPVTTDSGTVVSARCMECGEKHLSRLGQL